MNFIRNNSIFKKGILGFVLLFVLLAPVSISHNKQHHALGEFSSTILIVDAANTSASAKAPPSTDADASGWFDIGNIGSKAINTVTNSIGNIILSSAAAFTWLGGELLNYSLNELVFGMGEKIKSNFGNSINLTWTVIRDICNLAFIFGFIFIGIRTIIEPDSASTKRFLSKIIIGALLINFSLFFVKIIIDFSNFTAMQVYTSMTQGNGNISTTIADILGIVSFYDARGTTLESLANGTSFWFFIFGAVFLIIAAFIFMAAAIMLISRFVALTLIMVFSPILFAATVFPQTEKFATDTWSKLIGYAFFAPAYLLLTLTSLTLLEGLDVRGNGRFTDVINPNQSGGSAPTEGFFGIALNFCIAIGLLYASLNLAQKLGMAGGNMVVSKTKTLMGGATAGALAWAGRNTAGRFAYNRSQDENLRDRASKKGVGGFVARQQLAASAAIANTTFDARNVGGSGKKMGIGDGGTKGYGKRLEDKIKAEQTYADGLGFNAEKLHANESILKSRIKLAEDVVSARKKTLADESKTVREKIKNASRFAQDASLRQEERASWAAEAQNLKLELDTLATEHKESIESAQHDVDLAKKTMEDTVKSIKGERKKNYADNLEATANLFSIRGIDLTPGNREAASVIRGNKDLGQMFRGIKEKAKSKGGDDHGHGGGDHGGGHGKKDDHGHGGGDHGHH